MLRYEKYVIPGIPVVYIYANNSYLLDFNVNGSCRRDFFHAHNNELLHLVNDTTVRPIHRCQRRRSFEFELIDCGLFERDTVEYKKCSRCKTTYYCSKECQVGDWKIHKRKCNKKKEQSA